MLGGSKKSKTDTGIENKMLEEKTIPLALSSQFDLKKYINQYSGHTRIKRLQRIAKSTEGKIQLEAFRLAITETKQGLNFSLYEDVVKMARETMGEKLGDEYNHDPDWVDNNRRKGHEKFTQLEKELKHATRIGTKEPIWNALIAVGNHRMLQGSFDEALTCFLDSKEHHEGPEAKMTTFLSIIEAAIANQQLNTIKSHAPRVQNLLSHKIEWKSKINASLGLYYLSINHYNLAASHFLQCSVDLKNKYNHVICLKDIAIYGSFCALASFNRPELKAMLENEEWKKFLELVPLWKKIIKAYIDSRYAECFQKINMQKPTLLLDIYLAPNFSLLDTNIHERAFQQYFRPFASVKIPSMAKAFNINPVDVEQILVDLIKKEKIQARIDSHNKILFSRLKDERSATYTKSFEIGSRYVRDVKSLLMRMSLIKSELIVKQTQEDINNNKNIFKRRPQDHRPDRPSPGPDAGEDDADHEEC